MFNNYTITRVYDPKSNRIPEETHFDWELIETCFFAKAIVFYPEIGFKLNN